MNKGDYTGKSIGAHVPTEGSKALLLRETPEVLEKLKKQAAKEGRSLSVHVRVILREAVGIKLKAPKAVATKGAVATKPSKPKAGKAPKGEKSEPAVDPTA